MGHAAGGGSNADEDGRGYHGQGSHRENGCEEAGVPALASSGPMGPNVDVVFGAHPATTVDVLGWDGQENEQDTKITNMEGNGSTGRTKRQHMGVKR